MVCSGRDKIETPEQVLIGLFILDSFSAYIHIHIAELLRFRLMRRLFERHFSLSKLKKQY